MDLFDATLDLGRFAQGTADYTITSISGNRIYCDNLFGRVAEYGGGTIWFRTGNSAGKFGRIKAALANAIELQDTYPDGFAVGDQITIGSWLEFDTQKLVNAINSVLSTYKILLFTSDMEEYDPNKEIYELPEGCTTDIRRVIIAPDPENPDLMYTCHFWKVMTEGWLKIYGRRKYPAGSLIGLYYVTTHGPAEDNDGHIHDQVDPLYLRYMAWLYLCRNLIQNTHKDNLVASDMYNEAKIYERDNSRNPNKALGMRNFTFPAW